MPFLAAPYGKDSLLRAFLFDQTAHLRCFLDGRTDRLVIVADDDLAPVVRVGNASLSEQTTLYNGSVWWKAGSARLGGSSAIPYGVYEPKDGASGYRTVGMQQYLDRSGGSWILATDHASLSGPAGTIRYDRTESLWILGDKGEGEWWQSAAGPSRFGVMSLDPWRHDADADEDVRDPTRGSIDLAFDRFVGTAERSSLYVAEVAVWR